MKKIFLIVCGTVALLILASVLFWGNVFRFGMSEGWVRHEIQELSITLSYPQEMAPEISLGTQETSAVFLLGDPARASQNGVANGIHFSITRYVQPFENLNEVVPDRETFDEAVETTFAGYRAFRYETRNNTGIGFDNTQVVLFSPAANEIVEISYITAGANGNQGYQQIAEEMLGSFEIRGRGTVSPLAIIVGMVLVLGVLTSFGLLLLMKR